MRKSLYTGPVPSIDEEVRIFEKAKSLIEKNGIKGLVLEMSQPTCVGGATFRVTSKKEIDRDYIGYRGYLTYNKLCKRLEELKGLRKYN